MTVVICVRDPDASNDYRVFGEDVEIIDVDLGYMDLEDPAEFAEWADGHYEEAKQLEASGEEEAAKYMRDLIDEMAQNFGHAEEVPASA